MRSRTAEGATLMMPDARRARKKSIDESYKELLTETDLPLFNVLRKWRAERCKEEGVPT